MGSNAIVSLAILKVNYDEDKDYLDTFLPMVAECIRVSQSDIIGIVDIQEAMKTMFYLDIPQHAIRALLNKAYRAKYLSKENRVFTRNREVLNELKFNHVKTEMMRKQSDLINDLIRYVHDKFDVNWNQNESEEYLLKFIESNQIMSFKRRIIIDNGGVNISNRERLYVAKYIEDLISSNSYLFEYLEEVLKGLIISTVVFLNEPSEIRRNFKNMSVYFDTSFIVFALGYAGESKKVQCDELLKLVYENNIRARCFRHSIDEVIGILTACAHRVEKNDVFQAYGPSMEYFINTGKRKSDIIHMITNLEEDLSSINIKIEETPEYNNKYYKYCIGEEELKEVLKKNITYAKDQALDRDVKSIAAITRLRNGKQSIKIEDSTAIFVTTNNRLVREVNTYLNINEDLTGVMPIISDYALTNLLWLKKPLISKDLSRKRIIAECFAATQPDEVLWNKYIDEVEKLRKKGSIGEDESYYFKYAPVVKTICMDITHGDNEILCEGTAIEIIRRAKEAIEMKAKIEELNKVKELEKIQQQDKAEIIRKEAMIKKKEERINEFAVKESDKVKRNIRIVLTVLWIIGGILGQNLTKNILKLNSTELLLIIDVIIFFITIVGIVFSIKGESISTLSERIAKKKYEQIIKEVSCDIDEN